MHQSGAKLKGLIYEDLVLVNNLIIYILVVYVRMVMSHPQSTMARQNSQIVKTQSLFNNEQPDMSVNIREEADTSDWEWEMLRWSNKHNVRVRR